MAHEQNVQLVRQALEASIAQTEQEQKSSMSAGINGLIKAGLTKEQVLAIAQFQSAGMQYDQALLGHLSVALLDLLDEKSTN